MQQKMIFLIIIPVLLIFSGCTNGTDTYSEKGAKYGAAAGSFVGRVIGRSTEMVEYVFTKYLDEQEAELKEQFAGSENVVVSRLSENELMVSFKNTTFRISSSTITTNSKHELAQASETLNQYPDTVIVVRGHTDNTGSASMNQLLSERRANAVKHELKRNNVETARLVVLGYGETMPISSNNTSEGRQQNRRVELLIQSPN